MMTMRSKIVVVAFLVLCVAFLGVSPVHAQSVPVNGTFDSNVTGWGVGDDLFVSLSWLSSDGHTANGSMKVSYLNTTWTYDRVVSIPVTVGSSASLTYWQKSLGGSNGTCGFWAYTTDNTYSGGNHNATVWTQYTVDLSAASGKTGVLYCTTGGGGGVLYDDISVTNSTNVNPVSSFNGTFLSDTSDWLNASSFWSSVTGNPAGDLDFPSGGGFAIMSRYYQFPTGDFTFEYKSTSATSQLLMVCLWDTTLMQQSCGNNFVASASSFTLVSYDIRAHGGHNGWFTVYPTVTSSQHIYFDNFCPAGACPGSSAIIPTAIPFGGFPYGYGTPFPVMPTIVFPTFDWSQYPTPLPVPSRVDTAGTPQAVYFKTPPIVGITGTVVAKIDDSTPVKVQFAASNYTPVAAGAVSAAGAPAVGTTVAGAGQNLGTDFSDTTVPAFGTDTSHPFSMNELVNMTTTVNQAHFCIPSITQLVGESMCYDITIESFDQVYVFGIDMTPWLTALGGALVFYVLVRQFHR